MIQLLIDLEVGPETDAERLAETTRQLRRDLLELDMETADFVAAGSAPQRAKAGTPIDWGKLLVTLTASGGGLTTLINVLQSWINRRQQSSIALEIDGDRLEITGTPTEQQQRLIDLWLSRHQGFIISDD
jgi:hypothetical protein